MVLLGFCGTLFSFVFNPEKNSIPEYKIVLKKKSEVGHIKMTTSKFQN